MLCYRLFVPTPQRDNLFQCLIGNKTISPMKLHRRSRSRSVSLSPTRKGTSTGQSNNAPVEDDATIIQTTQSDTAVVLTTKKTGE